MQTLETIIASYAFDKMQDYGLLLLPLPTGAGKSYTVFNFIHNVLIKKKTKQKIIFVTSLKKNLQIDELKSKFSKDEQSIFDEKVLLLKSNLDFVLDNWDLVDKDIPNNIKEFNEYKKLNSAIRYCKEMEENIYYRKSFQILETVKTKKEDIKDIFEPNFRKRIKSIINEKIPKKAGYKARLTFVKSKMPWLLKLYPQILSNEKQVFLMSMDKFLLRNDSIVDKSYFIYKQLAKDAIIFIDEFDATKETVLRRLIDNATDSRIDYVITYKMIHDRLEQGNFPASLISPSENTLKRYKEGKLKKNIEDLIPELKERSIKLYNQFNMQYFFKNIENENEDAAFLFQDLHSLTISNKENINKIVFKENKISNLNEIFYFNQNDDNTSINNNVNNFIYMVASVRAFLQKFSGSVHTLAINLQELQRENDIEDYTFEEALRSVLDNFFPGDSYSKNKEYFVKQILLYRSNLEETKKKVFDGSFFENGFSYYAIEDNNNHTLRSSIMMTSLESTPEKILLDVCKKAKVFGISATANYNTLIGNYALEDYLIPKLKKHFYELNDEEFCILKEQFEKSISHYDRIKINTLSITSDYNYNQDSWKAIFKNDDDCEEIYNLINQNIPQKSDSTNYLKNRYLRIAKVFKFFLETKDIKSFLCMLNKFPDDKYELNKTILRNIFEKISYGSKNWEDYVLILRSGNDYEIKKEELLNQLKQGHKKIVISTYATIGAGQNLQYKVSDDSGTEIINDFEPSKEKDFDAIYLDKPTNLIKQLYESTSENDFTEYLAQLEYLMTSGEMSRKNVMRLIKEGFKLHYFGLESDKIKASDIESSTNLATKVLVQAVGRLCRTNRKNKNIYIFYDDAINEVLNIQTCTKNLLNPEFKEFIKSVGQTKIPDKAEQKLIDEGIEKSEEALIKIKKYVQEGRNGWSDNAMEQWQKIRYWVMQHPTLSREEFNNCDDLFQPFYIALPRKENKVWYSRKGDFEKIEDISFEPKKDYEYVSAESARLEKYLYLPGIRTLFEKEKFAITFEKNDYILCPPVFTNIYKGALGEYAGREILRYYGIELEEITNNEFFELFDFKIPNKDVYIDFKNWNSHSAFLPYDQKLQDHIHEKLKKVSGKKAIIINIFAEEKKTRGYLTKEKIIEVPYLFDNSTLKDNKNAFDKLLKDINEG